MFLLNINKMNNKLTLTRYLYFADEVALSLLDCLIEQRDLNEALFWVDELYSSGFAKDIWLLLWNINFKSKRPKRLYEKTKQNMENF